LIREIETTTASVHDSQIDLSQQGEVVYRDRGYFGAPCKGHNATMNRATRNHPLSIREKMRNKRITRKRAPGERPYAVIKNMFLSGHVKVTTLLRTHQKYFHLPSLQPPAIKYFKPKKHPLANANKKNKTSSKKAKKKKKLQNIKK
jgi:IS5 family transposase